MRKFATLDAPLEDVLATALDLPGWSEWRPGLKEIEVVERSDSRAVAVITQHLAGSHHDLKMEYRFRQDGFSEIQIDGWLRSWVVDWRFLRAPSGSGTVISAVANIEMGMIGLVISRRRVLDMISRLFDETVDSLTARLAGLPRRPVSPHAAEPASRIRIYRTENGLEVWLDEQRYLAVPVD